MSTPQAQGPVCFWFDRHQATSLAEIPGIIFAQRQAQQLGVPLITCTDFTYSSGVDWMRHVSDLAEQSNALNIPFFLLQGENTVAEFTQRIGVGTLLSAQESDQQQIGQLQPQSLELAQAWLDQIKDQIKTTIYRWQDEAIDWQTVFNRMEK